MRELDQLGERRRLIRRREVDVPIAVLSTALGLRKKTGEKESEPFTPEELVDLIEHTAARMLAAEHPAPGPAAPPADPNALALQQFKWLAIQLGAVDKSGGLLGENNGE